MPSGAPPRAGVRRLASRLAARLPQKAAALVLALALWAAWRLQLPAP